jgi:hypothetical protein
VLQVTVEGKLMAVKREKAAIEINNRDTEMMEWHLSDSTATIPLKVWGPQIEQIDMEHSYKITALGTRSYEYPYLTTTSDTQFCRIEDICEPIPAPVSLDKTLRGPLLGVNVTSNRRCAGCKKILGKGLDMQLAFVRCSGCSMKQRTSMVDVNVSAEVTMRVEGSNVVKLTMPHTVLVTIVQGKDMAATEALEEYLLLLDCVTVTYQDSVIVSAITP